MHYFKRVPVRLDLFTSIVSIFLIERLEMKTYIKSYDMKGWKVIKLGDMPIPPNKKNGKGDSSTEEISLLENYIDEQMEII